MTDLTNPTPRVIELPIVVAGRRVNIDGGPVTEIEYANGTVCRFPQLTPAMIAEINASDPMSLAEVPLQDIVNFLRKVGRFWSFENANQPLCRTAVETMSAINGYDQRMAQREMNVLSVICSHGEALHDLVDAELGNRFYLEEWIPNFDAYVHAVPHGRMAHVLVGNVPVSSAMSLVRGLLAKNTNVAKLPRRDPVTALAFVLSCIEIDPDHPVTRSLTAAYWAPGSEAEKQVLSHANAVCVWGGQGAVDGVRAVAPSDADILVFGPKRSFSIVGRESADSAKVARDLAHDVSINDQEACFSPQMAFVEGDVDAFIGHLGEALKLYSHLLPKSAKTFDDHAHVQMARLTAAFRGDEVSSSDDTDWSVIKLKDPANVGEHPLGRVIFVVPVDSIQEALAHADRQTQTITLSPWSRNVEIRDRAARLGVAKITEIGLAEWQRIGAPHDGILPMARMVRWVGLERGLDYLGKTIEFGPVDTTGWLMMSEALPPQADSTPNFG